MALCGAAVPACGHSRLSDDDLVRSLAALDAYIVRYWHGTHFGLLELCYDLGVTVVAPMVGHWFDQHDERGAEPRSIPARSDRWRWRFRRSSLTGETSHGVQLGHSAARGEMSNALLSHLLALMCTNQPSQLPRLRTLA